MSAAELVKVGAFLKEIPGMLFAYAFGSQVSGTKNAMSDLDLAIYAAPPLSDEALESLQSEIMEVARRKNIDLVDLHQAPPLLAYEIAVSGKLLFTKNSAASNRYEGKARLHYLDTQRLRNIQNDYLRRSLHGS